MRSLLGVCVFLVASLVLLFAGCGSEKEPPDCSKYSDECPSYAAAGYFCEGSDLFSCSIACDPDCGCFSSKQNLETCDLGCEDDQDGAASCTKQ